MEQLKRLKIEGFKSIKQLDLHLRDVNVLVGPNGSGKSNFISFFRMLNALIRHDLRLFVAKAGQADALLYYGPKETEHIRAAFHFGRNEYSFKLIPTEDSRLIFAYEQLKLESNSLREYQDLGKGHQESNLRDAYKEYPTDAFENVYSRLGTCMVYHFHDTGAQAPPKRPCNIHDNDGLRSDAGNIAAFLYLLKEQHAERYHLICKSVQRIFPRFDDFALRPNPHNPETIRLEWREKESDYRFQPHQLSDGTLRFICLATVFLQPNPPTAIIVDEPELGLHPRAIGVLAGLVRSAASRSQVILSTQSVTLLNQFDPDDIIVVDREEDTENGMRSSHQSKSVFRRLENQRGLQDWLQDYTVGELWEMNMIGGRP
jgi:predicted ATPase